MRATTQVPPTAAPSTASTTSTADPALDPLLLTGLPIPVNIDYSAVRKLRLKQVDVLTPLDSTLSREGYHYDGDDAQEFVLDTLKFW